MPPATVERVVPRALTRRPAFKPPRSRDAVARIAAYRQFLWRTPDVIVNAVDYPGGLVALIRDREGVTLRLVRLLHTR